MSLATKVLIAAAGMALALPAAASAEPTVDAAKAIYQDLGLTQLTSMPSGRVDGGGGGGAPRQGDRENGGTSPTHR